MVLRHSRVRIRAWTKSRTLSRRGPHAARECQRSAAPAERPGAKWAKIIAYEWPHATRAGLPRSVSRHAAQPNHRDRRRISRDQSPLLAHPGRFGKRHGGLSFLEFLFSNFTCSAAVPSANAAFDIYEYRISNSRFENHDLRFTVRKACRCREPFLPRRPFEFAPGLESPRGCGCLRRP